MQTHTVIGEKILARSDSPYLQMGAQIARSHHDIIIGGDGRTSPAHFDPAVLNSFKTVAARFREIWDQHANA